MRDRHVNRGAALGLILTAVLACRASVDVKKVLAKQTVDALCGYVRNANNDPVSGVPIVVSRKSDGVIVAQTQSDASGAYSLPEVTAGWYVVKVDPPDSYHKLSQEVEVRGKKKHGRCDKHLNVYLCLFGEECVSHLWVAKD